MTDFVEEIPGFPTVYSNYSLWVTIKPLEGVKLSPPALKKKSDFLHFCVNPLYSSMGVDI